MGGDAPPSGGAAKLMGTPIGGGASKLMGGDAPPSGTAAKLIGPQPTTKVIGTKGVPAKSKDANGKDSLVTVNMWDTRGKMADK